MIQAFLKTVPRNVWIALSVITIAIIWVSYSTGKVNGCAKCKA